MNPFLKTCIEAALEPYGQLEDWLAGQGLVEGVPTYAEMRKYRLEWLKQLKEIWQ